MPIAIAPAASAVFGVSGDDTFQSKTISTKVDKKEARGRQGQVIALAFYGKSAEHSIEALGTIANTYALGAVTAAPANIAAYIGGTVFVVDELTIDATNDDFTKSTIKVTEYVIED